MSLVVVVGVQGYYACCYSQNPDTTYCKDTVYCEGCYHRASGSGHGRGCQLYDKGPHDLDCQCALCRSGEAQAAQVKSKKAEKAEKAVKKARKAARVENAWEAVRAGARQKAEAARVEQRRQEVEEKRAEAQRNDPREKAKHTRKWVRHMHQRVRLVCSVHSTS